MGVDPGAYNKNSYVSFRQNKIFKRNERKKYSNSFIDLNFNNTLQFKKNVRVYTKSNEYIRHLNPITFFPYVSCLVLKQGQKVVHKNVS